jgi:hypothetical protein
MARKVVDNATVAHLWAHQVQDSARNGNDSFSFEGPTLFSYQTAIAVLMKDRGGRTVAVFSARTYSITTTGHTREGRSAASHLTQYSAPELESSTWRDNTPERLREVWAEKLEELAQHASEGKNKRSRAKRFGEYCGVVSTANRFCEAFGLDLFPVPSDADAEATLARMREESARRDAERAEGRKIAHAAFLAEQAVKAEAWKRGEFTGTLYGLASDLMRVEGDEVVTTRGARVPVDHVRRAAKFVLGIVRAGRTFTGEPEHPVRLGHYRLDSIDADGTVRVGCHTFDQAELERVARLIAPELAIA